MGEGFVSFITLATTIKKKARSWLKKQPIPQKMSVPFKKNIPGGIKHGVVSSSGPVVLSPVATVADGNSPDGLAVKDHGQENQTSNQENVVLTAAENQDVADDEWGLSKQCVSVFFLIVYQCKLCKSFNSTRRAKVKSHLKEKHCPEWLILKDISSSLAVESVMQTVPQENLEEMVEAELNTENLDMSRMTEEATASQQGDTPSTSERTPGEQSSSNELERDAVDASPTPANGSTRQAPSGLQVATNKKVRSEKLQRNRKRASKKSDIAGTLPRSTDKKPSASTNPPEVGSLQQSATRAGLRTRLVKRKPLYLEDKLETDGLERQTAYKDEDEYDCGDECEDDNDDDNVSESEMMLCCTVCRFKTLSEADLKAHLDEGHPRSRKKQKYCIKSFQSKQDLKIHKSTTCFSQLPLQLPKDAKCLVCSKTFTKSGLQHHLSVHKEAAYSCKLCDFQTSWSTGVKMHMKKMHCKYTEFYHCPKPGCSYKSHHKGNLKLHIETHSDVRYVCETCGRTSKNRYNLKYHREVHMNHIYKCPKCDHVSKTSRGMRSHLTRHATVKKYKCDKCEYASITKMDLNRHLLMHSSEKPNQCTLCVKSYKHKHALKRHMKGTHLFVAGPVLPSAKKERGTK